MSIDLTNKAYLSAITVTNIFKSFYLQDGSKSQLAYRYGAKITAVSPYVFDGVHTGVT